MIWSTLEPICCARARCAEPPSIQRQRYGEFGYPFLIFVGFHVIKRTFSGRLSHGKAFSSVPSSTFFLRFSLIGRSQTTSLVDDRLRAATNRVRQVNPGAHLTLRLPEGARIQAGAVHQKGRHFLLQVPQPLVALLRHGNHNA